MSDSPDAIRKYIAPRPSAVTESSTNVLIGTLPAQFGRCGGRPPGVGWSRAGGGSGPEVSRAGERERWSSCGRLRRHAEVAADERGVAEELRRRPGVDDAALVEHDDVARE